MSRRSIELTDKVYEYILANSLRESDIQRRLREETASHPSGNMQISPEQGQFMAMLARLIGAQRYLEIGVFTGYSSLTMALAMPRLGAVVACDVSEEYTSIARRYWKEAGVDYKIDLTLAPAMDTLNKMIEEGATPFDIAFIDADKGNMPNYYEACLRLVRPGGLIMIDNVLWSGKVADEAVEDEDTRAIRDLNAKLNGDNRIDLSLLPIGDGLTLARKR